jgi:hypothetical protein
MRKSVMKVGLANERDSLGWKRRFFMEQWGLVGYEGFLRGMEVKGFVGAGSEWRVSIESGQRGDMYRRNT